jgi:hypothetical protein
VSNTPKDDPSGLAKVYADELDNVYKDLIKQINTYLHSSPSSYLVHPLKTDKYTIEITLDESLGKPNPISLSKVDDPDWDL